MNHLTLEQQTLLALLRNSLWGEQSNISDEVNWEKVDTIAQEQGVVSFAYDGAIKAKADVPSDILQKWKIKMIRGVMNNERLMIAQDQIFQWFSDADIPAVVLKGSSIARCYPQPDLRVLGDIDILVHNADIEKATAILEQHGFTLYENDPGYHISFKHSGVHVELHYDVTGFPKSEGGRIAKEEAAYFLEHITTGEVANHRFPVLAESAQAMSLLLHMIRHMFGSGIGLRQLCDWAVYVTHADPVCLSNTTLPIFERCGLLRYAKIATKSCACYLGMPTKNVCWCDDVWDEEYTSFISNVFCEGNMGTANKDGMGSLFTYSKAMGTKQSSLGALLARLTKSAYQNFPVTEKMKFLLPIFWVYLPVRTLVLQMLGLRTKKSVTKVIASAKQRRTLYDMLKPFDLES